MITEAIDFGHYIIFKSTKELFLFKYIAFFAFRVIFYGCFVSGEFDDWDLIIFVLSFMKVYYTYPIDGLMFTFYYIILLLLLVCRRFKFLSNPVLLFFGTISYPLYLIHQNIGYVIIRTVAPIINSASLAIVAAISVSLVLASLLNFYVERPSRRLIRCGYQRLNLKKHQTADND